MAIKDFNTKRLEQMFHERYTVAESGCWEWTQYLTKWGYGYLQFSENKVKCKILAHRFAYFIANPDMDESLLVCHKCDNPKCVNPEHLFLGTNNDNIRDCVEKKRQAIGQKNGRYIHGQETKEAKLYRKYNPMPKQPNTQRVLSYNTACEIKEAAVNGMRVKDIVASFGVERHLIQDIKRGKSKYLIP